MSTHKQKLEIEIDVPDGKVIHIDRVNMGKYGCTIEVSFINQHLTDVDLLAIAWDYTNPDCKASLPPDVRDMIERRLRQARSNAANPVDSDSGDAPERV